MLTHSVSACFVLQKKIVLARIERHQREVDEIKRELEEALSKGADQDTPEGGLKSHCMKVFSLIYVRTYIRRIKLLQCR